MYVGDGAYEWKDKYGFNFPHRFLPAGLATSKRAIQSGRYLTKAVALEVAESGITVNAICPGYVLTPLVERQIPDTARARGISEAQVKSDVMLKFQPTKEFVSVEEVAATALFLASGEARSITGTHVSIDGGWTAQ